MLSGFDNAPIHPMIVHFPIVLWLGALVVAVIALRRDSDALWSTACWLLHAGTIGALAAVASGLWEADLLGHGSPGHDLVHVHRNFMLVATGLGVVSSATALYKRAKPTTGLKLTVAALLLATTVVTTFGADRGAELVYRYGVGVKGEPPPQGAPHDHGDHALGHDDVAATHPEAPSSSHHAVTDAPHQMLNSTQATPARDEAPDNRVSASAATTAMPSARSTNHPSGHAHAPGHEH